MDSRSRHAHGDLGRVAETGAEAGATGEQDPSAPAGEGGESKAVVNGANGGQETPPRLPKPRKNARTAKKPK